MTVYHRFPSVPFCHFLCTIKSICIRIYYLRHSNTRRVCRN